MSRPTVPPNSQDNTASPDAHDTKIKAFGLSASVSRAKPTFAWRDTAGAHKTTLSERTVAGSATRAGLVIADPTISRIHAEFEVKDDGLWVRDLGSKNGTFVEGVLVTGARVPQGAKVVLGSTELTITYEAAEEPVELWPEPKFGPLLGVSTAMRQLFAHLARIAPTDSPVMIQGETGTGKELVATAIHEASGRGSKAFVIVDCAALPENLIETELFGHAKGAFTGAMNARVGAIEGADGGTVFLDEIGELPLSLQPRLLRVIESGMVRRVGENTHRKVDVRFLSATHRDLRTMVNAGAFREDLYFRLAVLPADVPPLREHLDDIPLLVQSFLPKGMIASPEVLRELVKRPWLGNVRELRNFVHRATAVGAREALMSMPSGGTPRSPSDSPAPAAESPLNSVAFDADYRTFRQQWIERGEREYFGRLLAEHNRNVAAAAKRAGVDRTYVYRLIRELSL